MLHVEDSVNGREKSGVNGRLDIRVKGGLMLIIFNGVNHRDTLACTYVHSRYVHTYVHGWYVVRA